MARAAAGRQLFDARKAAAGLASLEAVFRGLMAIRMEPEPVQLPLTPEAAVFFDGLQQELTKQARVEDGLMAGWLGKGPLKVLSYALVIEHLVHGIERAPLPTAVSLSAIEAAASYLRGYLQPMALKTIWLTGSDQKRGLAVKVAATIQEGEPPQREDLQRAGDVSDGGLQPIARREHAGGCHEVACRCRSHPAAQDRDQGCCLGDQPQGQTGMRRPAAIRPTAAARFCLAAVSVAGLLLRVSQLNRLNRLAQGGHPYFLCIGGGYPLLNHCSGSQLTD